MWRKWLGDPHFGRVHRFDIVSTFLKLQGLSPARILDAGCGNGAFLLQLKRMYPNTQITGIDLAPPSTVFPAGIGFWTHNLEYPLPTECRGNDLIISIEVLQYAKDELAFLRNLRDAAIPGGKLILHVMTATGLSYDEAFGFRKFLRRNTTVAPGGPTQTRPGYSAPELARLLKLSGWNLQAQEYTFGRRVMLAHTFFEVYRQWRGVPYLLTPFVRMAAKSAALGADADGAAILIYANAI